MALAPRNVRMQQRRATAAEWAADNPVLADGELGMDTDSRLMKMGDGVTTWNSLSYYGVPNVTVGPTAPSSPSLNDLWVDTT